MDKKFLSAKDIDLSNAVFFELSNPYYTGTQCNNMDFNFEYPKERIHIIQTIKLAVRCGLDIKFKSYNREAEEWTRNYYETYKS